MARALLVTLGTAALEIGVAVEGTTINVWGDVSAPLRRMAVETVASVDEVGEVVSTLELEPPAGSEDELAAHVRTALGASPATKDESIEVRARGHSIALAGDVRSDAVLREAERLAWTVRGVNEVENGLRARHLHQGARMGEDIRSEVVTRLQEVGLEGRVGVSARPGFVRLEGWVARAEDRVQALAAAWVAGVETVDGRSLKLVSGRQGRPPVLRPVPPVGDGKIERQLRAILTEDGRFAAARIDIDVNAGAVTLKGAVPTSALRRAAPAIALTLAGVVRVEPRLAVEPALVRPDSKLASLVHAALARDPYIDSRDIRVEARAGHVRLVGRVDVLADADRARFLAAGVPGVSTVDSRLRPGSAGVTSSVFGGGAAGVEVNR